MNKISIKAIYLAFISTVLKRMSLDEKEACARRRFLRLLNPAAIDLEIEENDLRLQHCDKDDQGNFKIVNREYTFVNKAKRKAFEDVWNEYHDTKFYDFTVDESNKVDFEVVKGLIGDEIKKKSEAKKFNDEEYTYVENLQEVLKQLTV